MNKGKESWEQDKTQKNKGVNRPEREEFQEGSQRGSSRPLRGEEEAEDTEKEQGFEEEEEEIGGGTENR